jgi:hypothetical protein
MRNYSYNLAITLTIIFLFLFINFGLMNKGLSSQSPDAGPTLKYRTNFGSCPSRSAGTLTLTLVKEFERNFSLVDVKKKIVSDNLKEKFFLSSYRLNYDPLKKFLELEFDCPEPLMKVQVYKNTGLESYDAILVSSGELYDPTYEVLLREEKKLSIDLPFLAIPVGEMDQKLQLRITNLFAGIRSDLKSKLSEVILNENRELTVILSFSGKPSSVFMGDDDWDDKISKLDKIVNYMEQNKKIPSIINLTNAKKVVVKFNDKF